jgi:hypothetical protein
MVLLVSNKADNLSDDSQYASCGAYSCWLFLDRSTPPPSRQTHQASFSRLNAWSKRAAAADYPLARNWRYHLSRKMPPSPAKGKRKSVSLRHTAIPRNQLALCSTFFYMTNLETDMMRIRLFGIRENTQLTPTRTAQYFESLPTCALCPPLFLLCDEFINRLDAYSPFRNTREHAIDMTQTRTAQYFEYPRASCGEARHRI